MFSLEENFTIGKLVVVDFKLPCDNTISESATVGSVDGDVVSFIFTYAKGFYLTKPSTADIRVEVSGETICYKATIIPNISLPFVTARIEDRVMITEKRKHVRINTCLPVHCLHNSINQSEPQKISGRISVNISAGGIRLRIPEELPIGKNVVLSIGLPVGPEILSVLAKTVFSRYNECSGLYSTAFEFTFISPADREAISHFVTQLDTGRQWQERNRQLFQYELDGGNCLKNILKNAQII